MLPQELYEFNCKLRKFEIKQVELAKQLGMSKTYINEVLRGKRQWQKAIKKFDVALEQIIKNKAS